MDWRAINFKESIEFLKKPLKEIEFVKGWVEGQLLALQEAIQEQKLFFTSSRSFNITKDVRDSIISDFIGQNPSLDGILKSSGLDNRIVVSYDIRLARV